MDHDQEQIYNGYRQELQDWKDMWGEMSPDFTPEATPSNETPDLELDALYDRLNPVPEELLQEHKTPNPVYPDSVGPDAESPKRVWADEETMKEIQSLKDQLFKLENKMAELGGVPKGNTGTHEMKFGEEISSEMKKLKERIEQISSTLGIKNEPSPWETKKAAGGSDEK